VAFEVQAEPERNRIHITLEGFASLDDVKQFERDLQRAIDTLPNYRGRISSCTTCPKRRYNLRTWFKLCGSWRSPLPGHRRSRLSTPVRLPGAS